MNKRIAKKKLKKAIKDMRNARKTGVAVMITTHAFVNEHGKECSPFDPGARFITYKKPQIKYFSDKVC